MLSGNNCHFFDAAKILVEPMKTVGMSKWCNTTGDRTTVVNSTILPRQMSQACQKILEIHRKNLLCSKVGRGEMKHFRGPKSWRIFVIWRLEKWKNNNNIRGGAKECIPPKGWLVCTWMLLLCTINYNGGQHEACQQGGDTPIYTVLRSSPLVKVKISAGQRMR